MTKLAQNSHEEVCYDYKKRREWREHKDVK